MKYRSLFLSDTHLFAEDANLTGLLAFLRKVKCEYLYLLGDIFDLWVSQGEREGDGRVRSIVATLLAKAKFGCITVYVPGNHDDAVRGMAGVDLGGIYIERDVIHVASDGKRYLCCHGDEFDTWMRYRSVSIFASRAWDFALRKRWSLATYLLDATDGARDLDAFIVAAQSAAKKYGCDGVICGHTHLPAALGFLTPSYYNCGSWAGAGGAIVERKNGKLEWLGA